MERLLAVTRAPWEPRGPLWSPIRRLPSACVAPVASKRSSGATFGRERPREWCPQRPSDSPNVTIYNLKPMIFEGRLFAEIGVQGSPWVPRRRFKEPQGSPTGAPKGTQGPPREPPGDMVEDCLVEGGVGKFITSPYYVTIPSHTFSQV